MLIESVPNISEGRNLRLINSIVGKIKSLDSYLLKDVHYDYDHNRSVFTILGKPSIVFESIHIITQSVINLDINNHVGVHPRTGIIDVIPFIPVKNISYQKLIRIVDKFAISFSRKYGIPVYLYYLSARKENTRILGKIRNKGIEFIKRLSLEDKDFIPDIFEDYIFHPTLGITFIGVRPPLIAFNFNLHTPDVENVLNKARKVASGIRESNGGIKNVQALAFFLPSKNTVQLSINVLEADKTDFFEIFQKIIQKLNENELILKETELVGCFPSKLIENIIKNIFKTNNFTIEKIVKFQK